MDKKNTPGQLSDNTKFMVMKCASLLAPVSLVVFSYVWPVPLINMGLYLLLSIAAAFSIHTFVKAGSFHSLLSMRDSDSFGVAKVLHAQFRANTAKTILVSVVYTTDALLKVLPTVFIGPVISFFTPNSILIQPYISRHYFPTIFLDGLAILSSGILLVTQFYSHFGAMENVVKISLFAVPYLTFAKILIFNKEYGANRLMSVWHPAAASASASVLFLFGIILANLSIVHETPTDISLSEDIRTIATSLFFAPSRVQLIFGEVFAALETNSSAHILTAEMHLLSLAVLSLSLVAANIYRDFSSKRADQYKAEAAYTLLAAGQSQKAKRISDQISDNYIDRHLLDACYFVEMDDFLSAFEQLKILARRKLYRTYSNDEDSHHLCIAYIFFATLVRPENLQKANTAPFNALFDNPIYPLFLFQSFLSSVEKPPKREPKEFRPMIEVLTEALPNWGYTELTSEMKVYAEWMDNPKGDDEFIRQYQLGEVSELVFSLVIVVSLYAVRYQAANPSTWRVSNHPRFGQDYSKLLNRLLIAFFSKNPSALNVSDLIVRDVTIATLAIKPVTNVQFHLSANQKYISKHNERRKAIVSDGASVFQ